MARKLPIHPFKVVLLGDTGVGKTNLITQFVKGEYSERTESTIGVAFFSHTIKLRDESDIKFEIWDTAGQERYANLAPMYYRGAEVAIVTFDITIKKSFERAKAWIKELRSQADLKIFIALAGNKLDISEERRIDTKEAQAYADEQNLLYVECSAKTGQNVKELFLKIAESLPKDGYRTREKAGTTSVFETAPQNEPKSGCC